MPKKPPPKIDPCPFCNGPASVFTAGAGWSSILNYFVRCDRDFCRGTRGPSRGTAKDAAAAWNQRGEKKPDAESVKRLADKLKGLDHE